METTKTVVAATYTLVLTQQELNALYLSIDTAHTALENYPELIELAGEIEDELLTHQTQC